MRITKQLKALRLEAGLSLRELSTSATMSPDVVGGLERNPGRDPRLSTVENILGALGYELDVKKRQEPSK